MARKRKEKEATPVRYELILHDNEAIDEDYALSAIAHICGHTMLQCIQLSTIITNNGECAVKVSDNYTELMEMQAGFNDLGFGAHVQVEGKQE